MRAITVTERIIPVVSMKSLLKAIVCIGALIVLVARALLIADVPLWLDETWSAMIATQADWGTFWREAWLDCNPPLYYLILAVWTGLAGDSNLALRLPSFVFTTSAALAAFRFAPKELGGLGRWTWSALLLFWLHALTLSIDARGYGLLLLLSVVSCILFARLYQRISLQFAAGWVAVCSLMFLTHYYAAALIAAQGIFLIGRHRLALLKIWPAALIGLPALAWFAVHIPRLADYSRPDVAWYDPLQLANGLYFLRYVVGHPAPAFMPLVLLTLFGGLALRKGRDEVAIPAPVGEAAGRDALIATALSGALALGIVFAVGMMRASLTSRYLVPMVPPVLLGLVLIALQSKKRELVCLLLVSIYLATSLNFPQLRDFANKRNGYGFEKGSEFIGGYNPTQLVFAWDHPAAKILDRGSLEKIGGFFLERSGANVETTAIVVREDEDPNTALSRAATGERPVIIWLYNKRRKSAAQRYPSRFESDRLWDCRSYVQPHPQGDLGVIACAKKVADHV